MWYVALISFDWAIYYDRFGFPLSTINLLYSSPLPAASMCHNFISFIIISTIFPSNVVSVHQRSSVVFIVQRIKRNTFLFNITRFISIYFDKSMRQIFFYHKLSWSHYRGNLSSYHSAYISESAKMSTGPTYVGGSFILAIFSATSIDSVFLRALYYCGSVYFIYFFFN